jgi:hypothetical protein
MVEKLVLGPEETKLLRYALMDSPGLQRLGTDGIAALVDSLDRCPHGVRLDLLGLPSWELLQTELSEFLPSRPLKILKARRILTVYDLTQISREQLVGLPGLGARSLADIDKLLEERGLSIGMEGLPNAKRMTRLDKAESAIQYLNRELSEIATLQAKVAELEKVRRFTDDRVTALETERRGQKEG